MRLLDVHTYQLHTFYGVKIPQYAILSHTWLQDHEEVTFAHLQSQARKDWSRLPGAQKIEWACWQAIQDGYSWAWVDTCCIDKTNNAELSEAINSMFRWYKRSEACYVYLLDVDITEDNHDILTSRWWSRAWTLQELVAPIDVRFYDMRWRPMGSKADHAQHIANTMNIDEKTLHDPDSIFFRSVARRMSWAAHREATRDEDLAYSLLGIFNINMTMQYGEGDKAFLRLQKEITQTTNDMSIFAWGFSVQSMDNVWSDPSMVQQQSHLNMNSVSSPAVGNEVVSYGLYAARPQEFSNSQDVVHLIQHVNGVGTEERHGMQIVNTAMILSPEWTETGRHQWAVALLPCMLLSSPHSLVGILLRRWHRDHQRTIRCSFAPNVYSCLVSGNHTREAKQQELKVDTLDTQHTMWFSRFGTSSSHTLVIRFENLQDYPFELLDTTPWQKDERRSHCFTLPVFSIDSVTIVRFHRPNSPVALYAGFKLGATIYDRSQVMEAEIVNSAILALPASTAVTVSLEYMEAALDVSKIARVIGPRDRCGSFCGHDRVYVTVTQKMIFNQAVTTMTLGKGVANTSALNRDAICLKRDEWFFEETRARPNNSRKKGFLGWIR
jgi:hypothetical protein